MRSWSRNGVCWLRSSKRSWYRVIKALEQRSIVYFSLWLLQHSNNGSAIIQEKIALGGALVNAHSIFFRVGGASMQAPVCRIYLLFNKLTAINMTRKNIRTKIKRCTSWKISSAFCILLKFGLALRNCSFSRPEHNHRRRGYTHRVSRGRWANDNKI